MFIKESLVLTASVVILAEEILRPFLSTITEIHVLHSQAFISSFCVKIVILKKSINSAKFDVRAATKKTTYIPVLLVKIAESVTKQRVVHLSLITTYTQSLKQKEFMLKFDVNVATFSLPQKQRTEQNC